MGVREEKEGVGQIGVWARKERAKKEKTHPKKGGALKRGSDRCLGGVSMFGSAFVLWLVHTWISTRVL